MIQFNLKHKIGAGIILLFVLFFGTCVKPFYPDTYRHDKTLVIEEAPFCIKDMLHKNHALTVQPQDRQIFSQFGGKKTK